jgi:hypothetical protein
MTFARQSGPDGWRCADGARTLQIPEIRTIQRRDIGSMVCGISGLVMGNQARERGHS